MGAVYLLHFDPPYKQAKHYIGWTGRGDVGLRFQEHLAGRGNPLVAAAVAAGCQIILAGVIRNVCRNFERHLKNRKDTPAWCPCCCGNHRYRYFAAKWRARNVE